MGALGAYTIVVGDSSTYLVLGSGLVSMEQAALLMMQRVASAEADGAKRIFALTLGPVRTRLVAGELEWVSSDQVGAAAVALSASSAPGSVVQLHDALEVAAVVDLARAGVSERA